MTAKACFGETLLARRECMFDRHTEALGTLRQFDAVSDEDLSAPDVAEQSLFCARGLPGAENLDIEALCSRLDEWAELIDGATCRMLPKFQARPQEFENSEAYFRMLVMVTVLQRNLGVRYNPERMAGSLDCRDSRDLFIHGCLGEHGGTCASMPVLYLAIGRRLGYPLLLVGAKQHLFVRWEESGGEDNKGVGRLCS